MTSNLRQILILMKCHNHHFFSVIFGMISVDGNYVTREDMENFFTVCENGPLPSSVKEHFAKVCFFLCEVLRFIKE